MCHPFVLKLFDCVRDIIGSRKIYLGVCALLVSFGIFYWLRNASSAQAFVEPMPMNTSSANLDLFGLVPAIKNLSSSSSASLSATVSYTPTFTLLYLNGRNATNAIAFGDMNDDGALDIVQGNWALPKSVIYLNDLHGGFDEGTPFGDLGNTQSIALGDVDGDSMLDIVQGNFGQQSLVYLNDGHGGVGAGAPFGGVHNTYSIALGDVNGDAALDIIQGNGCDLGWDCQQSLVYLNDGHGSYGAGVAFGGIYNTQSIALGDVNGDNALDIIQGIACYDANGIQTVCRQSIVYLNNGQGGFDVSVPFGEANSTYSIALGDVNGDDALDIIQGNAGYYLVGGQSIDQQSMLYLNDGHGNYGMGISFGDPDYTHSVALGDVNGDGALDIIQDTRDQLRMYLNDGYGGLGVGIPFGDTGNTTGIVLGDVNDDGALDIVQGNQMNQSVVYLNDGHGGLGMGVPFGDPNDTYCIALGDVDRNGALDIVQGNSGQSMVYLNYGGGSFGTGTPFGDSSDTTSIALGDVNDDGALDIVQGNYSQQSLVYLNNGHGGFGTGAPFGDANDTSSIALGDVNGDGALDIIQGQDYQQNVVYLNDAHGGFGTNMPFGDISNETSSITLGDVNDDGALDIVQGNLGQQSLVYLNNGHGGFGTGVPFGDANDTSSIALGDVNGDGALDIIQGTSAYRSVLYLNDGHGSFGTGRPFGSISGSGDIVLGDMNGDSTLDMIQGHWIQESGIYLNDGHGGFGAGVPFGEANATSSIALGDVNGDGTLDIVQGNGFEQQSIVYYNTLFQNTSLPNNLPRVSVTRPVTTANADFFSSPQILKNSTIPITYTVFDPEGDPVRFVRAYYSPNGSGRWLTATAASGTATTNLSTSGNALQFDGTDDHVEVQNSPSLNITDSLTLEAWVNLSNPNNDQKIVGKSPMGSGFVLGVIRNQLYAEIWDSAGTRHLQQSGNISANKWTHLAVTWQTGGHMIGYINGTPVVTSTTGPFPIGANTNVLRIGRASWSGPHFVAGEIDDVRVYSRALSASDIRTTISRSPVSSEDGLVGAWEFDEGTGTVVHDLTTHHNDGVLINGPTWVIGHVPVPTAHVYYWDTFASGVFGQSENVVLRIEAYPSLAVQPNGVLVFQHPYASATTFPFRVRGTQVRVFSDTVPASNAIVYDLPDNQTTGAAVFADNSGQPFRTDGQGYLLGHGRINVGDRLIALLPITATDAYTLYYTNASPNPTGLASFTVVSPGVQTLTVTASNPLALFNLDVSLEWDARNDSQFMSQLRYDLRRASEVLYDWTNGQAALGPVNIYYARQHWDDADIRLYATNRLHPNAVQGGIVSTVITDPLTSTVIYEPGQVRMGAIWNRYGNASGTLGEDWPRALAHELGHYALFLNDDYLGVDADGLLIPIDTCTQTAMSDPYRDDYSELHGETDWSRVCANTLAAKETGRWDWATITTFYPWLNGVITNTGPSGLPLAVTQITSIEPMTPSTVLPVPIFYLSQNGGHVEPGSSARAFLFHANQLTDLGRPTLDQVIARGANLGDRLCVFELAAQRSGCEMLTQGDDQLSLVAQPDWQPDISMTPATSQTLALAVTNVPPGLSLNAQLYAADGSTSFTINLSAVGDEYTGIFDLPEPVLEGFIRVWVNEPDPRREIVTDYSIGGGPARMKGYWARMKGYRAPAASSDGQIILFGDNLHFAEDELVAFQAATTLSSVPAWITPTGHGYRLTTSLSAPNLSGSSISIFYAGGDVRPGDESWLRMYFWDGVTWRQLPTRLDTYHNFASAPTQGVGLYVLMASIEIPLYGPGWDLFAYPVQATPLVSEALASINGYYSSVYWYDGSDVADPWKIYAVGVPRWVNDLGTLKFGEAYWISLTKSITLSLNSGSTSLLSGALNLQSPPATFYGSVVAGQDFTPTIGMLVTTWIDGKLCGQTTTFQNEGTIVYSLNVLADGPGGANGCGEPGRAVTFKVGQGTVEITHEWDNNRVWLLFLGYPHRAYLPLVTKNY